MTKAGLGKSAEARIECWRARIAEQKRSGMSVGRFCQEQQITEQSFYVWRKRLRQPEAVRFALVERGAATTCFFKAIKARPSPGTAWLTYCRNTFASPQRATLHHGFAA